MLTFFLRRTGNRRVLSVFKLDRGVPYQWTPDGWKPQHFDYSGMGDGWADYDPVTVEEACQALLDLGVPPDELVAVIAGINPHGNLAKALGADFLAKALGEAF
jgi:hypothetical protein